MKKEKIKREEKKRKGSQCMEIYNTLPLIQRINPKRGKKTIEKGDRSESCA